jgi:hypothetical protein
MKYNEELMKANPYDIYVPIEKGTTKRQHKALDEFPIMKRVLRKQDETNKRHMNEDVILKMTLKALGVEENESVTSIHLLCSTLLGAKILLDNEKYVTLESVNGYINARAEGTLYKKAYIDLFPNLLNGCHKELEDGTIELDVEKYNAMITAVL